MKVTECKTISARIMMMKDGASKWDSMIREVTNGSVTLVNKTGDAFRNTYDILTDLGKVWGDLTNMEQAMIGDALFGKQNLATGYAILDNYEKLAEIQKSIADGAGGVDKEFDTYLQSTSAKLTQLKANMEGIFDKFVNSDMTRGFVGGLNSIVVAIDNILETFGTLPVMLTAGMTGLSLFSDKFRDMLNGFNLPVISNWNNSLDIMKRNLNETSIKLKEKIEAEKLSIATSRQAGVSTTQSANSLRTYQAQLALTTAKTIACSLATVALQTAMSFGLSAIISGVVAGLGKAVDVMGKYVGGISDYAEQAQNFSKTLSDIGATDSAFSRYETLNRMLEDTNLSLEKRKQLETDLEGIKNEITGLDSEYDWVLKTNLGYEQQLRLLNDIQDQKIRSQAKELDSEMDSQGKMERFAREIENVTERYERLKSLMQKPFSDGSIIFEGIRYSGEEAYETLNKMGTKIQDMNIQVQKYNSSVSSLQSVGLGANRSLITLSDSAQNVGADLKAIGDTVKFAEDGTVSFADATELAKQNLDELGESANEAETEVIDLEQAFKGLSDTFSGASSGVEVIDDVLQELKELGGVTESTYSKLISKHPEVLAQLANEKTMTQDLINLKKQYQTQMEVTANEAVRQADMMFNHNKSVMDADVKNHTNATNAKMQNDTDLANASTKNASEAVNSNGKAYVTDVENFGNSVTGKNQADISFQNAWTENTANSVNAMGGMYVTDTNNFADATRAKKQMLAEFNAQLGDLATNAMKTASSIEEVFGIRYTNAMFAQNGNLNKGMIEGTGQLFGVDLSSFASNLRNGVVDTRVSNTFKPTIVSGVSAPKVVANPSSGGSKGSGSKGSGSGSKSDADKIADKINDLTSNIETDRYFDLNNAIDSVVNSLEELKTKQDYLTGSAYTATLSEEVALMEQKQYLLHKLNAEQRKEAQELKDYLTKYGFYIDETGELINSQQRLLEIEQRANSIGAGANTEEALKEKQEWIDWVEELQEKTARYVELVNGAIPSTSKEWQELGNSIRKVNLTMLETVRDKLVDAIKQEMEEEVDRLKEEAEKAEEDAEKALEKKYKAKVDILENRIKKLKEELASLDDEESDKREKLVKLNKELQMWKKDDSVLAKKKVQELQEQIAKLEKEIKKDEINKEIEEIEKDKQEVEDWYKEEQELLKDKLNNQKETQEKLYKEMLSDKEAYLKADKLLQEKNMQEITRMLSKYSEDFKEIGSLLGENFAEALSSEIKGAFIGLDSLLNKTSSSNNRNEAINAVEKNTNSKAWLSDVGTFWIGDASSTQIYTDSTGTVSKGTGWQNGVKSSQELKAVDYNNGFYQLQDTTGNIIGWVDKDKLRKWNDISQFADGGRTPSNIDDGRLSILHSNEAILNANDTKKLDKIYDTVSSYKLVNNTLEAVCEGLRVAPEILNRINSFISQASVTATPAVATVDYNRVLRGVGGVSTNQAVTWNNSINVTNNTKNDSYFNAKSLNDMFKQQARRFK